MTAVRVSKPRRLSGAAAPAGITCLLAAVVLAGLGTTLAPFVAAGMLVACAGCCLGPVDPPAQGQITYEEPTR